MSDQLRFLQLLQLSDSALAIGGQAHSYGLETFTSLGVLTTANLETVLTDYLAEAGALEAVFCRAGYATGSIADEQFADEWLALNQQISALRTARETRAASAALGRRLLNLAIDLTDHPRLHMAAITQPESELHHAAVFGLIAAVLTIDQETATVAFLQQTLSGLLTAMPKLIPIGQGHLAAILWRLKPAILAASECSAERQINGDNWISAAPLLEMASLRHSRLPVRLFIS